VSAVGSLTALNRRQFLRVSSGLALGMTAAGGIIRAGAAAPAEPAAMSAYVSIGGDGVITIGAPNPDVGQGVNTALPMIVAEEMDAAWADVRIVNAAIDPERFGFQFAGGSLSVPMRWDELRRVGATARAMLIQAAAERLRVPQTELVARDSKVLHAASNTAVSYAELASSASRVAMPDQATLALKEAVDYQLLGRRIGNASARAIARGEPLFGIDVRIPGMVYACYEKCPRIGGVPVSANLEHIKTLGGILDAFIIEAEGGPYDFNFRSSARVSPGVAIVAKDTWSAMRARRALNVEWDTTLASVDDSDDIALAAKAASARGRGDISVHATGDVESALIDAALTAEAFYSADFVSHAQLEPQGCVAHVSADSAEVWTSSQTPSSVKQLLPQLLSLPPEAVVVHSVRGGGGFGRRLSNEYVYEAALISRRVGLPVKLQWQREDDMAFDYFRSPMYFNLTGGLAEDGRLMAWKNHVISGSADGEKANYGAGYRERHFPEARVPHVDISQTLIRSQTPTGAWRAPVSNIYAFAEQSFLNELAVAAGIDHKEFLLAALGRDEWFQEGDRNALNTARAKQVIRAVCEQASWGREMPAGRGLGLAFYFSHAGHVAEVAEVSVDKDRKFTVHDVWVAADVGQVINLSGVENQIEGSVVDGLSALANQRITIRQGQVQETNFDQYPLLRLPQAPNVHVQMMASGYSPTGAGEPALPPVAPAVGNAIFAACGERIRTLPFSKAGFSV
jgi:isoquinoline 1-oxidoreductase beta subunit